MYLQSAEAAQSNGTSLISLLQATVPVILGSLTTLVGIGFERVFTEREKRLQEIYSPLLDRVSDISDGDLLFTDEGKELKSVCSGISAHQRHYLGEDIESDLESIDEKINILNQFFNNLESGIIEHGKYHKTVSDPGILMSGTHIKPQMVFKQSQSAAATGSDSIEKWIRTYYRPVLESTTQDELKANLIKSGEGLGSEYANVFKNWKGDLNQLARAINYASDQTELPESVEGYSELFTLLQADAESLEQKLKDEIDKPWYKVLISQLS